MTQSASYISSIESKSLSLSLIDSTDKFWSLQKDWDAIYDKSNRSNIFCSWDWMFTWWEVFKDQYHRELFILALYQEDELVGLAPFQIFKPPFPKSLIQGKTLGFIGNGEALSDLVISEFQDLIVLPEYESSMIKEVSEYLVKNREKWSFADFEYILEDALILQCFDQSIHELDSYKTEYGVRFTIPKVDSFEQYQETMDKRWRKMFHKKGGKLTRYGEVDIVETETVDSIKPALDRLADMNGSRWRDKTGCCIFDSNRFVEFHQKILARLIPKNKAAIKTLTLDGEAMASYYFLKDKNQLHYYQSGFYKKYANRYSPLFILICNEIGNAIKNNHLFDFMFADDKNSYKKDQYSCEYQPLYRLRLSPQKHRLPLFHVAKYVQYTVENIKKILHENRKGKRGK